MCRGHAVRLLRGCGEEDWAMQTDCMGGDFFFLSSHLLAQHEWVVGGRILGLTNFSGLVGSLLEWTFCPPLPKLEIGNLIGSVAGDALIASYL